MEEDISQGKIQHHIDGMRDFSTRSTIASGILKSNINQPKNNGCKITSATFHPGKWMLFAPLMANNDSPASQFSSLGKFWKAHFWDQSRSHELLSLNRTMKSSEIPTIRHPFSCYSCPVTRRSRPLGGHDGVFELLPTRLSCSLRTTP